MGRIHVDLLISRFPDSGKASHVSALVDTGATFLCLPEPTLIEMGAVLVEERVVRLADETRKVLPLYGGLVIEVAGFGKSTSLIVGLPANAEPLVGYTVLEELGIALDFAGHRMLKVDVDLK